MHVAWMVQVFFFHCFVWKVSVIHLEVGSSESCFVWNVSVIIVEVGSSESRDSHHQKPASPSDLAP